MRPSRHLGQYHRNTLKALLGQYALLETLLTLLHFDNAVNDMGESSR
jgi:hypothetical protein